MVSVSSVLTAAVIQIPGTVVKSAGANLTFTVKPKTCIMNFGNGTSGTNTGTFFDCGFNSGATASGIRLDQFLGSDGGGAFNLLTVYAYDIFHFDTIQTVGK